MRFLYSLALWLALPLIWIRLVVRGIREPAYRERRLERLGFTPVNINKEVIWFHAVSVGETIAVAPAIRFVCDTFPNKPVLVTTTTPAGAAEVQKCLGDYVQHCYAPYDFTFAVKRFLKRIQPEVLILAETELWPNIIWHTQRRGVPVYLINARLSARSTKGYARIHSLSNLMIRSLTGIACQYEDTANRFRQLGANPEVLTVTGSIKFDMKLPSDAEERIRQLKHAWCEERMVWVAGSTHPGEEEIILESFGIIRYAFPNLLLILAPRHPHRSVQLARLCRRKSLGYAMLSDGVPSSSDVAAVLIVNEMGSLVYCYGLADVVFIGGSLEGTGGHNPIEPAVYGAPMIMGANRINFAEVCSRFAEAGCLHSEETADGIAHRVLDLLNDPIVRKRQGLRARQIVEDNRGAERRLCDLLSTWLK